MRSRILLSRRPYGTYRIYTKNQTKSGYLHVKSIRSVYLYNIFLGPLWAIWLEVCFYFKKFPNFHQQTWRNFEQIKDFDEICFSTKKNNIESLKKGFETVLFWLDRSNSTHNIRKWIQAKTIHCKQCNKVFDKKKIKCDECKTNLRHDTWHTKPISTRIVPQKTKKS